MSPTELKMRDRSRIRPLLDAIEKLWLEQPDSRLCQLLINVSGWTDPYHLEDDALKLKIEAAIHEKEWRRK